MISKKELKGYAPFCTYFMLQYIFYFRLLKLICQKEEKTLGLFKMLSGSVVTNQPRRQPGTSHLFDIEPRVSTGATDPKTPMGTKGLSPKAR